MATGTFRPGLGPATLTLVLAGCGAAGAGAFSSLRPQSPPAGWRVASIASGAAMAYPPSWQRQRSDTGTATAVLTSHGGTLLGYINLTPRQGAESLSNWAAFRTEHNAEEGDRSVRRLAAAKGLRFLDGHGTCVKDAYTTTIGTRYIELACLVIGTLAQSVIVATAPPQAWSAESGTLQREIEAVRS